MASNKNMIITERGLNTLSRELLNKRKFQTRLIEKVGSPTITDGIAFSISDSSYFKHNNINFANTDKIAVAFKGVYIETSNEEADGQVLWSLTGTNTLPLTLVMFKNKISLYKGNTNLGDLVNGQFSSNKYVNIKVLLEKDNFVVTFIYDNKYNVISGQLFDKVGIEKYTNILIGSNPPFTHWLGNIDLNDFIIYKNKEVYYAPSTEAAFHFTKILISNGNLPLNDFSTPLLNNVYEFNISEIKRTGNNLLLLARIDSDVYLNIKEVGLYSNTDEGPMLFSKVTGLSIKKQKDLGYGLLFNVNTKLGVVNTVALPEIVVHEQNNTNQKDFMTVKRVHTYIAIDMERIIAMNALMLGYGRTQKIESNYAKLSSWTTDSSNTQNFLKSNENVQNFLRVDDKISSSEERTFNRDKVNIVGTLKVSDTGVATNFSSSNYATINYIDSNDAEWKYSASFKLTQFNTAQTIFEAYGRTVVDPLFIDVDRDNNCFIQLGKREEIKIHDSVLNTNFICLRKSYKDSVEFDSRSVPFYAWQDSNGAEHISSHIIPKGTVFNQKGILKEFSDVNYATIPNTWNLGNKFRLNITFSKSKEPVEEQVLFSAGKDFIFQIKMNKESRLIYQVGNGKEWLNTENSLGKAVVLSNDDQTIAVSFNGTKYEASFVIDDTKSISDWTFESTEILPEFTGIFGQNFNHKSPWKGSINLLKTNISYGENTVWSGAISSKYVFTKEINPSTSSVLYDIDEQVISNFKITSATSGVLFREFLFKAYKEVDYYISAEYKDNVYEVYVKEGNLSKRLAFRKGSTERINPVTKVFLGIDKDRLSPIKGTMYLEDIDIMTGDKDYSPVDKVLKEKNLTDYFYITEYPYSSFKAINLSDPENSKIEVLEGALTGEIDNINFNNSKGFSLCIKMFLKDGANEIILAKINKVGTRYFVLEYKNEALVFTLYQKEGKIVLKKQYEPTTFRQITDYPVTIFITYNGDPYKTSLKMYKNNELLDEFTEPMMDFLDAKDFVITNYLDFDEPSEINDVNNILSFEGELSPNEIFLINNLLDTNF